MINEILKETGKIKDDKELAKGFNIYLKGEKLETSIKEFWNGRETNQSAVKDKYPNMVQQLSFFYLLLQDINGFIKQSYDSKKYNDNCCIILGNLFFIIV